jgi:hypothetical protein
MNWSGLRWVLDGFRVAWLALASRRRWVRARLDVAVMMSFRSSKETREVSTCLRPPMPRSNEPLRLSRPEA